ncbi:hypothetical protein CROQUDRAFT_453900 [Cronartium quercuum f. sp. fusiforme G11]|uniref:Uncharacterized protein n=1 Tax=Cronartium quercuum f. sp. fusiforme G11 TaxID=708437 RepID=A0A9P6NL82_9BASI|nr:hypothetical protein CROQUDRAFT_453900 [Cronartium quercuum f. sp. fusiforme G11]
MYNIILCVGRLCRMTNYVEFLSPISISCYNFHKLYFFLFLFLAHSSSSSSVSLFSFSLNIFSLLHYTDYSPIHNRLYSSVSFERPISNFFLSHTL